MKLGCLATLPQWRPLPEFYGANRVGPRPLPKGDPAMADLFSPIRIGSLELANRLWMAPLTRCRAEAGHQPGPLLSEHYARRASAGLVIAEATMVSEGHSAFWNEPASTARPRWRVGA